MIAQRAGDLSSVQARITAVIRASFRSVFGGYFVAHSSSRVFAVGAEWHGLSPPLNLPLRRGGAGVRGERDCVTWVLNGKGAMARRIGEKLRRDAWVESATRRGNRGRSTSPVEEPPSCNLELGRPGLAVLSLQGYLENLLFGRVHGGVV